MVSCLTAMNFATTRFFRLKILIASNRCKYTPTKEFHISACGLKDKGFTERYKPCEKVNATGKSLSKALLFAEHGGEHVVYKNCSECQKQFLYITCCP